MPTLCEKNRREKWEQELRIGELQINSLKNDCRLFEFNLTQLVERYKSWLISHKMEATLDLSYYDKFK